MQRWAGGDVSTADLAWTFMLGQEFVNRKVIGAIFATYLYTGLLQRSPDPSGLSYWTGRLLLKTRTDVIREFVDTPEFKAIKLTAS